MALTDEETQHFKDKWGLSAATLALFPESYCRAIVAADKRVSRIDELRKLADEPHVRGTIVVSRYVYEQLGHAYGQADQ